MNKIKVYPIYGKRQNFFGGNIVVFKIVSTNLAIGVSVYDKMDTINICSDEKVIEKLIDELEETTREEYETVLANAKKGMENAGIF